MLPSQYPESCYPQGVTVVAVLSEHSVAGLMAVEVRGLGPVVEDMHLAYAELAEQCGQPM